MPIVSRLAYNSSGAPYQGFSSLHNLVLKDSDQFILAWFDGIARIWVIDCEAGIGELRRYYREQYERHDMEFLILNQDKPTWILMCREVCIGPFYSKQEALDAQSSNLLGTSIAKLQKP